MSEKVTNEELAVLLEYARKQAEFYDFQADVSSASLPQVERAWKVLWALEDLQDLRNRWEELVRATLVEDLTSHMENS